MNIRNTLSILILLVGIGNSQTLMAQSDSVEVRTEYGLNLSPIIVQLVPLSRITTRTGPYNFTYKHYKGNKAIRTSIGVDFNIEDGDIGTISHFNTRVGGERRVPLSPRWSFTQGIDFLAFFGGFNIPSDDKSTGTGAAFLIPDLGFGGAFSLGFQYNITPKVYLSTESMLYVGLRTRTLLGLQVVPPVSIFLHASLDKGKKLKYKKIPQSLQKTVPARGF